MSESSSEIKNAGKVGFVEVDKNLLVQTEAVWILDVDQSKPGFSFRVQGLGFRVQGSGSRAFDLGFRVQGLGFSV